MRKIRKSVFDYTSKILAWPEAKKIRERFRRQGKTVVFTNGCFDILHLGHLKYLTFAREQGDCLFVGLNTDASVRINKGEKRPLVPELERAEMLLGLKPVDYVVMFDEEEPRNLLSTLLPDILVKGEDWAHFVSGRDIVENAGGRIVLAKLVENRSTTNIIKKILETYSFSEK